MTILRRPVVSLEYVRVRIVETQGLAILAGTVQIAFTASENEDPVSWLTGEWQDAGTLVGGKFVRTARILAGPGGTYVPTEGSKTVWFKFQDTPEVPARPAGSITWY